MISTPTPDPRRRPRPTLTPAALDQLVRKTEWTRLRAPKRAGRMRREGDTTQGAPGALEAQGGANGEEAGK